jgi:hypothetical protein
MKENRNTYHSTQPYTFMFSSILQTIEHEFSGSHALSLATAVCEFHRIPISPHFREAAVYCMKELASYGMEVNHLRLAADGKHKYWNYTPPLEWKIETATLSINNIPWVRYEECPLSLIQRSHPVDIETDIVRVTSEEELTSEIEGKIIYSDLPLETMKNGVFHKKAGGVIVVSRSPLQKENPLFARAHSYLSLWGEPCSGFTISQKQSEKLGFLCNKGSVKGKMKIESSLYPGWIDIIEGYIPGETEEEVVVIAHLCHPRPSANDNASGVGVLMEIARVLNMAIGHSLSIPRRGIRFLLVPEILGTVAYCASTERFLKQCIAGINLDMVGQNQRLCGSTLFLERTPDALPSCVNDVAESICNAVLGNQSPGRPFSFSSTPFSRLSDHSVLSSPDVGIPCPMLIQWPDYFYHTSLDTPDNLDPSTMKKVGVMAATYIYFLATAQAQEAGWVADLVMQNALKRIEIGSRNFMKENDPGSYCEYLTYLLEREEKALLSVQRWADTDVTSHLLQLEDSVEKKGSIDPSKHHKKYTGPIPQKFFPGPIPLQDILLSLSLEERDTCMHTIHENTDSEIVRLLAGYWADGQRTIPEINRCISFERGGDNYGFLEWYFRFLEIHNRVVVR